MAGGGANKKSYTQVSTEQGFFAYPYDYSHCMLALHKKSYTVLYEFLDHVTLRRNAEEKRVTRKDSAETESEGRD